MAGSGPAAAVGSGGASGPALECALEAALSAKPNSQASAASGTVLVFRRVMAASRRSASFSAWKDVPSLARRLCNVDVAMCMASAVAARSGHAGWVFCRWLRTRRLISASWRRGRMMLACASIRKTRNAAHPGAQGLSSRLPQTRRLIAAGQKAGGPGTPGHSCRHRADS